jgi:hypothetical protein
MRYFLRVTVALAWGIWFGGLLSMFMFITGLFNSLKAEGLRQVFDQIAPHQFMMSERFELVFGMLALIMTFGLRLLDHRPAVTWFFGVLALAAMVAILKSAVLTPRMVKLIVPGMEPTEEFKRLHGLSMLASCIEAVLLLIAGAALPAVFNTNAHRDISKSAA